MAPRTRGEKGKKKQGESVEKFVSRSAEKRYHQTITTRKMIPERGFEKPGERVSHIVQSRNFDGLCFVTLTAVINLVHEFYANFLERDDNMVMVRGKRINISPDAINAYYTLPPVDLCHYAAEEPDLDGFQEIIEFLTDSRGSWETRGDTVTHFSASALNGTSKAFHYLICSKILPTTNLSEVTKERARLNYLIQLFLPVNLGRIIHQGMIRCARETTNIKLGFPSLITGLCIAAGVPIRNDEDTLKAIRPITAEFVEYYEQVGSAEKGPTFKTPVFNRPPMRERGESSAARRSTDDRLDAIEGKVAAIDYKMDIGYSAARDYLNYEQMYRAAQEKRYKGKADEPLPPMPDFEEYNWLGKDFNVDSQDNMDD